MTDKIKSLLEATQMLDNILRKIENIDTENAALAREMTAETVNLPLEEFVKNVVESCAFLINAHLLHWKGETEEDSKGKALGNILVNLVGNALYLHLTEPKNQALDEFINTLRNWAKNAETEKAMQKLKEATMKMAEGVH